MTTEMQQRTSDFRKAYGKRPPRDRQGDRRPFRHRSRRPDLPLRRRPRPAGRRARPGQDAAGADAEPGARPAIQPHPVHARPDAVGHHRHQHHQRRRRRQARVQLPAGPALRPDRPGRRDQPGHAQDAIGPAGSDAGTQRHRRRHDPQAARAVLRHGDAEPDRAGRDVSAARGPTRPLLLQADRELLRPRGDGDHPRPHDARRMAESRKGDGRRRRSSSGSSWCARCWSRSRCRTTRSAWCWRRTPAARSRRRRRTSSSAVGASPRSAQAIVLAAKVRALLEGRYNVSFEDVRKVYLPALRHRSC